MKREPVGKSIEEKPYPGDEDLTQVEGKLREGLTSLDRGEGIDGEAVLTELERRLEVSEQAIRDEGSRNVERPRD